MRLSLIFTALLLLGGSCHATSVHKTSTTATYTAPVYEPLDLEALILAECGPPGFNWAAGCHIELPRGEFLIGETHIGGCGGASETRNALRITGVSTGTLNSVPRGNVAGTTLRYIGPVGGVVLDTCGVNRFELEDLSIDALGAEVGIRLSSNNAASATSHFIHIADVTVDGAKLALHVTGEANNDQTDFVSIERVRLVGDVAYRQSSQQSVNIKLTTVEAIASHIGFEVVGGSFYCDNCYVGNSEPSADFIAFRFGMDPDGPPGYNYARHQVTIRNGHYELTHGRFIVDDSGQTSGSQYPIFLEGNSYSLQCATAGCKMFIVDANYRAALVMEGEIFQGLSALPQAMIRYTGPLLLKEAITDKTGGPTASWSWIRP